MMGFSTLSRWLRNAAGWSQEFTMYSRFTDRSRKVMQLANQEAQRFNHEYIGTEHVLLGLISEGSGVAANVLKNLDIDLRKVRREVERIIQHGPGGDQVVMGRLPHTPRAKKVLEYAIEEARALRHNYVGTEHLLLGLIREEQGVASQVLMNFGLKREDIRDEVSKLLGQPIVDREPAPPIVVLEPAAAPPPEPSTTEPAAVLAEHIKWLRAIQERAIAMQDFELAAEIRGWRERLIALRRELFGDS
jgi:ATP-dependent Clp protease ATP-binding subunit ClpA